MQSSQTTVAHSNSEVFERGSTLQLTYETKLPEIVLFTAHEHHDFMVHSTQVARPNLFG